MIATTDPQIKELLRTMPHIATEPLPSALGRPQSIQIHGVTLPILLTLFAAQGQRRVIVTTCPAGTSFDLSLLP